MRSLAPTCSIFCFPASGRTHSNCVCFPHSAHTPMAHPSLYRSMGRVEEDLDGFGRLRFLAFISRRQSIARPRESHTGSYKEGAREGGHGGERGRSAAISHDVCRGRLRQAEPKGAAVARARCAYSVCLSSGDLDRPILRSCEKVARRSCSRNRGLGWPGLFCGHARMNGRRCTGKWQPWQSVTRPSRWKATYSCPSKGDCHVVMLR